jgi:hypothetical protein
VPGHVGTLARSVFVLTFDSERVVGAFAGIPLADEDGAYQRPVRVRGISPAIVVSRRARRATRRVRVIVREEAAVHARAKSCGWQ